jgi:hypothetical protein
MLAIQLQAQPGSDLPSEQVEVIKIFEAQLAESEKVALSPELPPVDTTIKKQTFEVPSRKIEVSYPAPRIRPIAHKSDEEIPDIYKAYAKLGGGLPASIFGEGSFHTLVKKDDNSAYDLGLNVLHHSANFSNEDVENQRFAYTKAEGKGTYYFSQGYALGANLGYTSDKVHYYGYNFDPFNEEEDVPKESVKQLFSTFDLGAKIFNGVQTAGDLNYMAGVNLYTHSDNFAANETGLDLKGSATKWINGKHSFDLGLRTDFTWYNDTLETAQTLHNFTLNPSFTFHGGVFKVKVGGKIVSHDDEFELFPDLEAVVNLTGNELALYVGLEGDLQKNTFRSLTDYNPYLNTRFPSIVIKNTKYFYGYAGVRGNLKFFEYTLQAGYKPTNDLALYYARFPDDVKKDFEVRYDDVNIINLSGSLKANVIKGLEIVTTVSQNIFDTDKEFKAWHLPSLEVNAQAIYTTADGKAKAKAQLFIENGLPANRLGGVGRYDNLNGLFDISIGGEYWVVKNFGIFLDINNLLDNERERWRYYPTYGLNILGGITARF